MKKIILMLLFLFVLLFCSGCASPDPSKLDKVNPETLTPTLTHKPNPFVQITYITTPEMMHIYPEYLNEVQNIQLNVIYPGKWIGYTGPSYQALFFSEKGYVWGYSVNGTGSTLLPYKYISTAIVDYRENLEIGGIIQKNEGGNQELSVQIMKNGQILKQASTTDPYGIVNLSVQSE